LSQEQRKQAHIRFWKGEGPCLILIPAAQLELNDTEDYVRRFHDPRLMWMAEMRRAQAVLDWPTDAIATIRPNLGVIFVPTSGGLGYTIQPDQMPWPGAPLDRDTIRAIRDLDVTQAPLMRYAAQFYALHKAEGDSEVAVYLPDTQGIFDVAHLLYGEQIFYDMADDPAWVQELMEISLDLYTRCSQHLKMLTGQTNHEMIHANGTPQGIFFPHAGVRITEDTPTLLSPRMIEEIVMPFIERGAEPFGGAFIHYCGLHKSFFEQLCRSKLVRAIDLGDSAMYDMRWILERCAASDTVLYSRVAAQPGEEWEPYVRRLAGLIKETGARCILRPLVFPAGRDDCTRMRDLWHDLTA
jgi:hypothetical protein